MLWNVPCVKDNEDLFHFNSFYNLKFRHNPQIPRLTFGKVFLGELEQISISQNLTAGLCQYLIEPDLLYNFKRPYRKFIGEVFHHVIREEHAIYIRAAGDQEIEVLRRCLRDKIQECRPCYFRSECISFDKRHTALG